MGGFVGVLVGLCACVRACFGEALRLCSSDWWP